MTRTERPDPPHLAALKVWAEARGLTVRASAGTQREPANVVAVVDGDRSAQLAAPLLLRESHDSIDTAALYVINAIDRLRLDD